MTTKIKNNPHRYLTRAGMAGAVSQNVSADEYLKEKPPPEDRLSQGALDARWYVQLVPKKRS